MQVNDVVNYIYGLDFKEVSQVKILYLEETKALCQSMESGDDLVFWLDLKELEEAA